MNSSVNYIKLTHPKLREYHTSEYAMFLHIQIDSLCWIIKLAVLQKFQCILPAEDTNISNFRFESCILLNWQSTTPLIMVWMCFYRVRIALIRVGFHFVLGIYWWGLRSDLSPSDEMLNLNTKELKGVMIELLN
jgi:hypothetical protein